MWLWEQGSGLDINICKMHKSSTRTEIVWIFANRFWSSHAFPSSLIGEVKKLLLHLFHFPRMRFLSWKPRSPGNFVGVDLFPGRCACFTLFEFTSWWHILWAHCLTPRGSQTQTLSLCFLTYLHFPHYRHKWLCNVSAGKVRRVIKKIHSLYKKKWT